MKFLSFSLFSFCQFLSLRFPHRLNISQTAVGTGASPLHLRDGPFPSPLPHLPPDCLPPGCPGPLGHVPAGPATGPTFVADPLLEGGQSPLHVPRRVDAVRSSTGELSRSFGDSYETHGGRRDQVREQFEDVHMHYH